jgi:hypothetical protein
MVAIRMQLMLCLNKSVSHNNDGLTPLGGVFVPNFPPTFGHLRSLTEPRCNVIIATYGIPDIVDGADIHMKRAAIATFIGILRY